MINIKKSADCCGCTACASICAHNAITMKPDALGFLYPEVDKSKCVDCGLCEKVCAFNDLYDKSDNVNSFIYKGNNNSIEDVKTMKFISESLQIYKSNSQDDITMRIKERLLYWINITAEKYGRNFISKCKTSLDTYRRTIYTCFVFKILECMK